MCLFCRVSKGYPHYQFPDPINLFSNFFQVWLGFDFCQYFGVGEISFLLDYQRVWNGWLLIFAKLHLYLERASGVVAWYSSFLPFLSFSFELAFVLLCYTWPFVSVSSLGGEATFLFFLWKFISIAIFLLFSAAVIFSGLEMFAWQRLHGSLKEQHPLVRFPFLFFRVSWISQIEFISFLMN